MLRIPVSIITLLVFASPAKAQVVTGKLRDQADNSPLAGATVQLLAIKDSSLKFNTLSDGKGSFEFRNLPLDSFYLKIGFEGYALFRQLIRLNVPSGTVNMGIISMAKKAQVLAGITVTAKIPPGTTERRYHGI